MRLPTRQGGVKNRDKVYQVFAYNYRDDSRAQWDDSSIKNNPPLSTPQPCAFLASVFKILKPGNCKGDRYWDSWMGSVKLS